MKEKVILLVVLAFISYSCSSLSLPDSNVSMIDKVAIKTEDEWAEVEGSWPTDSWWESFGDEQLSTFIEKAFQDSPNLKAAIARVESAQQEAKKSRSVFLPQLDASLEDEYETYSKDGIFRYYFPSFPKSTNDVDLALNFNYNLDLFGRDREKYKAAISELQAQKADLSMSFLLLSTTLASVYFEMQSTYATLYFYEALLDLQQEKTDLAHQRLVRGIDNKITFDQEHADMLLAKENVISMQKQLTLYQNQIKFLMGLSPGDDIEMREPIARFDRPFLLPENMGLNLLSRRPDIRSKLMIIESMAHLVKSAKAAFYPNINLAATTGFNAISWPKLLNIQNFIYTITPALDLPLYLGGELRAQLQESRSNYSAAISDYNELVLKAAMEVSNYITQLNAFSYQQTLQKKVIETMSNSAYLTERRHLVGIDSRTLAINAEMALVNSYLKDISLQEQRHLSIVNLIKSLGGGYHVPPQNKES